MSLAPGGGEKTQGDTVVNDTTLSPAFLAPLDIPLDIPLDSQGLVLVSDNRPHNDSRSKHLCQANSCHHCPAQFSQPTTHIPNISV
jgi:hypothetical protein